MSGFLSPKYLKYRKVLAGGPIDRDMPCANCGYNLRGLHFRRPCPECGEKIGLPGFNTSPPPLRPGSRIEGDHPCEGCGYNVRGLTYGRACPECGTRIKAIRAAKDMLLNTAPVERHGWQVGLAVASMCFAVAIVARWMFFLAAARGATPALNFGYIGINAVNAIAWIFAVWMVTPPGLDHRCPWMRGPRLAARGLALMWIPGYIGLILQYTNTAIAGPPLIVLVASYGGRFLGGVGVLFVIFILSWVAEETQLVVAARRLNAALWILWFPTLLAQAFPSSMSWIALVPLGMILFFWAWLMTLACLGIRELHSHVRWSGIHALESSNRVDRIADKRHEMQEAIEKAIRPLPESGDPGEISLDDPS